MSKYDLAFKLSVIRHYQMGTCGYKRTGKRFGVNESCVRKWIFAYEHHGLEGITHRSGSYTAQHKQSVIQYKKQHHLSIRETATLFKIPSPSTVRVWERLYDEGGIQALTDNRGRNKRMSKHPKPSPEKPIEEMSQEELHAELQHLRMENAYLKKLRALIQEKKASEQKRNSSMN